MNKLFLLVNLVLVLPIFAWDSEDLSIYEAARLFKDKIASKQSQGKRLSPTEREILYFIKTQDQELARLRVLQTQSELELIRQAEADCRAITESVAKKNFAKAANQLSNKKPKGWSRR